MRSRAPLALMEQLVMVLVFALAAALCVQAFVLSDRLSRRSAETDAALQEAQSAAEVLKSVRGAYAQAAAQWGGTWNGQLWGWSYDADWQRADGTEPMAYHLLVSPLETETPLLGAAEVTVYRADGEVLSDLTVSWQCPDGEEESADG